MLAPINTNKHYVTRANLTVVGATIVNNIVVESVVAPASVNTYEVSEGSVVKAVHLELWIFGNNANVANTQFNLSVEKIPSGAPAMTFAQSSNLQSYPNKKNILFTSQGVINAFKDVGNSIPIVRNWLLIPKGKQRMGLGDKIVLNFATITKDVKICGLFIYKEYR